MTGELARAWLHPWFRVSLLIMDIRSTLRPADTWPRAKHALKWALAERSRLGRAGWFN